MRINRNFIAICFFTAVCVRIVPVFAQDVLCPEPSNTAMTAPADLAQVQSDIDRLALCVERARLLSDLDKTLKDREKDNSGADSLKPIVPLSPSAEDVSEIIGSQTIAVKNIPQAEPLSGSSDEKVSARPSKTSSWKIRRIWGEKGKTKAQLGKSNGTVATVIQNDVLPDGYVVVLLSSMGVTLKKDGKTLELEWAEAEAAEE